MAGRPLRPATDRSLGGPLPRQLANRTQAPLQAHCCFNNCLDVEPLHYAVLAQVSLGYSPPGGRLPTRYSPGRHSTCPLAGTFAFDLHVLGTPPALILSQDQTLIFESWTTPLINHEITRRPPRKSIKCFARLYCRILSKTFLKGFDVTCIYLVFKYRPSCFAPLLLIGLALQEDRLTSAGKKRLYASRPESQCPEHSFLD